MKRNKVLNLLGSFGLLLIILTIRESIGLMTSEMGTTLRVIGSALMFIEIKFKKR